METKKDAPDPAADELDEACGGLSDNNQSNNELDDDDEEVDNESTNLWPHKHSSSSPISSNVSSSSGFFSSASSKPTTPTNLQLTDRSDDDIDIDDGDDYQSLKNSTDHRRDDTYDRGKSPKCEKQQRDNSNNDENTSDNQYDRPAVASTSKSVRIRSKIHHHRRYKQISLDDEIVIESDSSLQVASDVRRRTINQSWSKSFHNNQTPKVSGASNRRRSEEENSASSTHHHHHNIVSILKRKDSTASSNAGLVTFDPNVVDTETRSRSKQGILKKRSSLDESSRYRDSHSPSSASSESEKGCLIKSSKRRNSLEETSHHGILKQKSYDSSGGGSSAVTCASSGGFNTPNSANVHGILKKPSLTPSDNSDPTTKHVSISEAVILAAAELCKDLIITDDVQSESYIRPILKTDNEPQERKPKPILKKYHSTENEEIRSILKSRKSSREESMHDDS